MSPDVRPLYPWQQRVVDTFRVLGPGEQLRLVHGRRRSYFVIVKDGRYVCALDERMT